MLNPLRRRVALRSRLPLDPFLPTLDRAMIPRAKLLTRASSVMLTVYWLALFVGTHVPKQWSPDFVRTDKAVHMTAYAGLSFLLAWFVSLRRPLRIQTFALLFAVVAGYGALDELTQLLIPGRYGEVRDWAADLLGGVIGLIGFRLLQAALKSFPIGRREQRPIAGGE